MRLLKRLSIIFLLFLACSQRAILKIDYAADQPTKIASRQAFDFTRAYHQVTTHPDIDAYPAVSPDGKWIAFASRRSGNMDIWLKPVRGGSAVQLTTHRADDIMPAWSPDSKKIVFVSYREDAAGDVWIVPLRKVRDEFSRTGNPKKLTHYLGMDVTPAFSPDGKHIAFTSDRDGQPNIYLYRLSNKKIFKLTSIGGMHPTWSPAGNRIAFISHQQHPSNRGQICYVEFSLAGREPIITSLVTVTSGQFNDAFPCWNPFNDEIYFSRYDQDTNGDGQITPDDKPGLWKAIFEPPVSSAEAASTDSDLKSGSDLQHRFQEIELIPNFYRDYFPVCSRDSLLYFVSRRSGNEDIWSIPSDGVIPRQEDGFLQYQFAVNYFPLPTNDLIFKPIAAPEDIERNLYRLLAFQRVIDFFPAQHTWVGWSLYEIGRTYLALRQVDFAAAYFQEIVNSFYDFPELSGKARLRLFEMGFDRLGFDERIQALNAIADSFQQQAEIAAEALLFRGEVYYLSQNYARALESFEQLIKKYPGEEEKGAIAQLLIGAIYTKFGQTEEVIGAYTSVFENYPSQPAWGDSALNRILSLERGNDFASIVSSYRNIIARYGQHRRLAARAQLQIGEQFLQQGDYDAALQELDLVGKNYSDQREELAQAELMAGKIFELKAEDLRAISQYKKIIADFGDVQSGLYVVQAKEQLLDLYMRTGRQLQMVGEIRAANNRYRDAITIFPRHLEAHRGYVATLYAMGKIDQAIQSYQNLVASNPNDEVIIYILGLCYSYKATETSDRTKNIEHLDVSFMIKSNELIQRALSKNYRLIQAYLTLSFNYESIEKHESALRARDRSFFVSLVQTAVAPVKSLVNWITFQKEKTPEHYFERAIEALTTAIAINDEQQNPGLESELALNLAGNFYNLGEFGFEQAYKYYGVKLKYDSTFINQRLAAEVYKRMGHCALVVEDFKKGPGYLQRAINLYKELNDPENWLLNIKRLALLYQLAGDYDQSAEYFKIAAEEDRKKKRYNQQLASYRSIAYNYQMLNADDEAIRYAQQALNLMQSGKVTEVKEEPNWIKISILGIEFPVWNLGQIGAGASTAAAGFTTNEERAFIYSILGQSALEQRSIPGAINYLNKKIEIYRQRKDRLAEAIFLNNIGYLYYLDLNYPTAWDYFERSLKICQKDQNTPGTLINILNLASLGVLLNKLPSLPIAPASDTTQPKLAIDLSTYLTASLKYLQSALALYDNELIGFLHEKAQLYNLLGNLHYFKNAYLPDSLRNDPAVVVQTQLARLEDLAVADSCFRAGLQIAQDNNFKIEQLAILQNLGYLSLELGDDYDALNQFERARDLALKYNFLHWLWRIDAALGQIHFAWGDSISQFVGRHDANFYLNEAITVVEQTTLQLQSYRATPFYSFQVRRLYQTAIDYHISRGRFVQALRLSEQYRGKQFLDLIGSHKLELKKERHKIFIGNARFLIEEMTQLDNKIRLARESGNYSRADMAGWTQEKQKLQKEYSELLEEIKAEDPELESFIQVEPVTFAQVQTVLDANSLVVDYFCSQDKLYLWTVTSDSVSFFDSFIPAKELEQQINRYFAALSTQSNSERLAQTIWQNLIQPIADQIDSYDRIIIIPDGSMGRLPFSYLINFALPETRKFKKVVVAPSLSNYYYCFQKRKIRGNEMLLAGANFVGQLEDFGYDLKNLIVEKNQRVTASNNEKEELESADLIYLKVKFQPEASDPLISTIQLQFPPHYPSFQIREAYNFDLQSALFVLNGIEAGATPAQLALQRAILYAGAPSLIISLWDTNDDAFWKYLFEALQDYSAADAFLRAQIKMKQAGLDPYYFAGYQFIGFEGMDDEQELKFAEERFVATVRIGNNYVENKEWGDAVAKYEQALVMARKRGDQQAIDNLYQYIIESAASGGFYDKAISYQLEALESARANNDIQKIADGYAYLVLLYTENKNFDQAVFYQNEYLKLVEQYDLKPQMAQSYRNLGLVYERGRNFDRALENFDKALALARDLGDSLSVAHILKDRGRIYLMNLDNYSKAIENQEQALKIFQALQNREGALEVLQNLGYSHELLANYQLALNYQSQALELADQLNDSAQVALSKHFLANLHWKMGNYEPALRNERQAQQIFVANNYLKLQSVSLVTEGLILMSLGNLEAAAQKQQAALELAEQINDRPDMASIHKNLGLIFRAQNRWDEALDQFQQALQIDQSINSRRGLGYGYRDIGSIYLQQGMIDEALNNFHKALAISKEILDGRNEAQCLYEIGRSHLFLQNIAPAMDTLVLAVQKARALFIPEVEWRSHRLIGQLHYENNNWDQSIAAYAEALRIIETMRSQIKVEEYKSGFIDDKLIVYYDLVDLYLQLDQPGQALEIVERAKSRNFIDLLANRDIKFSGKVSEEKLKQGKQFENEIRRVQNEIAGLLVKQDNFTRTDEENLANLNGKLENLKKQYQEFLIDLKAENAELAEMVAVEPPRMDSLKAMLPDGVIMLEYFYTDNKFYGWAVTNRQIVARQQAFQSARLISQVDTLRTALQGQKPILNISQALYRVLIAPFESEIKPQKHIVFIPHGILHYLPFATLQNSEQKYLVERFSISLAPSATVLGVCMSKGQSFVSSQSWKPRLLALGNPDLDNPQLELPFAEKEIESVQLLYQEVTAYLNQYATETKFKQLCQKPNMMLLSCHGEFDVANPLFSSLLLAADDENDGRLTAQEIFELDMNAYLVAMSACETGLARVNVGDEVIGLSRSFIYAGSSSLLSSLWKVDDLATAVMIKRFFRYLKEGESRARALQKAMEIVRMQINVHPVYWAAFNITGDFR